MEEGDEGQLLMGCPEQMWALFITTDQRAPFMCPRLDRKDAASFSESVATIDIPRYISRDRPDRRPSRIIRYSLIPRLIDVSDVLTIRIASSFLVR